MLESILIVLPYCVLPWPLTRQVRSLSLDIDASFVVTLFFRSLSFYRLLTYDNKKKKIEKSGRKLTSTRNKVWETNKVTAVDGLIFKGSRSRLEKRCFPIGHKFSRQSTLVQTNFTYLEKVDGKTFQRII